MIIRNLTISIVLVQLMTVSFAQKITTKMEWAIRDKMINVSEAKKNGFLVTFRGAENMMANVKYVTERQYNKILKKAYRETRREMSKEDRKSIKNTRFKVETKED